MTNYVGVILELPLHFYMKSPFCHDEINVDIDIGIKTA